MVSAAEASTEVVSAVVDSGFTVDSDRLGFGRGYGFGRGFGYGRRFGFYGGYPYFYGGYGYGCSPYYYGSYECY